MSKPTSRPSILGDLNLDEVTPPKGATAAKVQKAVSDKPAKGESAIFKTSVLMHRKVHDVLREIAYVERKSLNNLFLEGIDHVLKTRQHPSSNELSGKD